VAARSKARVCSRSFAGNVGSKKKKSRRKHGCLSLVSVFTLSGRGLCDELITRPEESYRMCVCHRE